MKRFPIKSSTLAATMLCLAAPAYAQDALCGGTGDGGQWIGGDEATSDITTADAYREQMALVLGGNEYVSLFSVSETTDVRVEAEGRGAGDPIIDILDESGAIIISDDDSGGNAASRAETTLDAGTYCMSMRSYDGGPMTAFVRIGRTEHDALTAGVDVGGGDTSSALGSCAEATPMGPLGSTVSASVDETAYWSFTLDVPTSVTVAARNENADPVITLFDESQSEIAYNDDFDGLNSQIDISNPLEPGTYCIAVEALDDTSVPIEISVEEYDPVAARMALYDRGEAAPPLDGSVPVTDLGALQTRLREDVTANTSTAWYSFEVSESSLIVAEAIGGGQDSDPWLVVYDDLGREIGQNDDYGSGYDSLVAARVDVGTYIVGVKQYQEGSGLIRLLLERYVRAQ